MYVVTVEYSLFLCRRGAPREDGPAALCGYRGGLAAELRERRVQGRGALPEGAAAVAGRGTSRPGGQGGMYRPSLGDSFFFIYFFLVLSYEC